MTTGQIIDLKLIEDISVDPWAPLSIMYVEDGMEYCQEDDRGRVLNPNEKRYLIFREHFPGDEFLNFYAFFLDSLDKRRLAILGIQTARMMMERMTTPSTAPDSEFMPPTTSIESVMKVRPR